MLGGLSKARQKASLLKSRSFFNSVVPRGSTAVKLIAALAFVSACAKVNLRFHNLLEPLPALVGVTTSSQVRIPA